MEKNKKIRREPIVLSSHDIALIHIFEKCDELADMWMEDSGDYRVENYEQYEKSAKQFISQLKGSWCVLFMESLIKEGFKTMVEEDFTAFPKERADEIIKELKEINEKRKT